MSRQVSSQRPRPWPDEEIRTLHALRKEQKLPMSEIARALDRSYFSVRDAFKKIKTPGPEKKVEKWDRDARKRAIDMIRSGVPLEEIATSVYPDKAMAVACKYLRQMYKDFKRWEH